MSKVYTLEARDIESKPVYDKDGHLETYEIKGKLISVMTEKLPDTEDESNRVHQQSTHVTNFGARLTPRFVFDLPTTAKARQKAMQLEVTKMFEAAKELYLQSIKDAKVEKEAAPKVPGIDVDVLGFDFIK